MNSQLKILDLSGLSEYERDALVNEAVAELDGWSHRLATHENPIERGGYRLPSSFGPAIEGWWKESDPAFMGVYGFPKRYATSADAVLPLLGKLRETRTIGIRIGSDFRFTVRNLRKTVLHESVWSSRPNAIIAESAASTFPLAACYVLLRANGIEVLG